jgi:hypothetical protein
VRGLFIRTIKHRDTLADRPSNCNGSICWITPERNKKTASSQTADPTILWTGKPNATWYQVLIVTSGNVRVYNKWFSSDAALCPGAKVTPADYECAVGGLGLNLQPGVVYTIWMRDWGPAGFSVNGTASANGEYNTGSFTYQP